MSGRYHHIFREPEGADTAVLLLHGILSAPQYFRFLLDDIPQNYAVSGILLEGHGGEPAGLAGTDMQAWKRQVQAQYRRLSAKYPHIIIAAHSMGTLFALQLAAERPEQIRTMLLLDVPLYAHLTAYGAFWGAMIGAGMQPEPQDARAFAMREAYSIRRDMQPMQYLRWIPRYCELFREMKRTRETLHRVTVPCTAFQSANDELVSLRTLPLLKAVPSIRLHVLRESSHFYYPAADEERILRAWRKMLQIKQNDQSRGSAS